MGWKSLGQHHLDCSQGGLAVLLARLARQAEKVQAEKVLRLAVFVLAAVFLTFLACQSVLAQSVLAQGVAGADRSASCEMAGNETVVVRSVSPHLEVTLADGRVLRLRGLRPPRGTKAWPELAAMARLALDGWVGRSKLLAKIESGPADRWGRRLAHLWLPLAAKPEHARQPAVAIGPGLVEAGWAMVDSLTIEKQCLTRYLVLEDKARSQRLGLWSDAHYLPVPALETAKLKERGGDWLTAQGLVVAVRRWKSLTFVNFSKQRGEGLGIMLTRRASKEFERAGMKPESLLGKHVRVRGLLELSRGNAGSARMRLESPLAIEILTPP